MSLMTWMALYCSRAAAEVSEKDALSHSLTKWRGLRPKVMSQHGVAQSHSGSCQIIDAHTRLAIDHTSCALCVRYFDHNAESFADLVWVEGYEYAMGAAHSCSKCPLAIARGGVPCDAEAEHLDESFSPYADWLSNGDPEPMIKWLEAAEKEQQ